MNSSLSESNPFALFNTQTIAILGAQFGDEGKGKLVDILAPYANVCARFNGGSNAGHTIVIGGVKYAMHLLPCGCLYPQTKNLLGNGVVIHLKTLMCEIEAIKNVNTHIYKQIFLSSRAHLLFDIHQKVDEQEELMKANSGQSIGTTKRGIGPCYASKASRIGVRVGDLKDPELFKEKYLALFEKYSKIYKIDIDPQKEIDLHLQYYNVLKDQIIDSINFVHTEIQKGHTILIEGANATMLDVDFGTYPYVTSSHTHIGGACNGLGVPPHLITFCVGVIKSYVTRVGEGPFLTELKDELGEQLLIKGKEFGTTTGRPRRCGWLDIPMIKYSHALNGFKALNLTKLDVLTGLSEIKICTHYKNRNTGELMPDVYYPSSKSEFDECVPIYKLFEGWTDELTHIKNIIQIPKNAHTYIKFIEETMGIPIKWVGVGPDRSHTITLN